jgi:hypothetical protein
MTLPIQTGRIASAQRCVIHGEGGVGKSELASLIPGAVFLDVEGSTGDMDVARLPKPTSWTGFMQILSEFCKDPQGHTSLIVDTADWAEALLIPQLCAQHGFDALGGQNDFGHSFNLLETEWCKFLDSLTAIAERGVHVVLLCHTQVKKREVPDDFGAFDKWVLKMEKKTSAKTIEWAREILFLHFKVLVVEDGKTKQKKGQGGERFIYASKHPCWDAKTRCGLPDEMLFKRGVLPEPLATLFLPMGVPATPSPPKPAEQPPTAPVQTETGREQMPHHQQVADLMKQDGIEFADLMAAIAEQGHFPPDTPFENLPADYVAKALIPNWPKVVKSIKEKQHAA